MPDEAEAWKENQRRLNPVRARGASDKSLRFYLKRHENHYEVTTVGGARKKESGQQEGKDAKSTSYTALVERPELLDLHSSSCTEGIRRALRCLFRLQKCKKGSVDMPYVTVPLNPAYKQLTLDDILNGNNALTLLRSNETNTRTYYTSEYMAKELFGEENQWTSEVRLQQFIRKYEHLYEADRHSLYRTFYIPKRSGGLRRIDAPEPPLMEALYELRSILTNEYHAMYHTAAFAYIKGRRTTDAVKRHQANNSRWFLKIDFHDFFGSTTKEFVLSMLKRIAPFSFTLGYKGGWDLMSKAIDLCFLDGKLPQGTPVSPMLTNLIMIPIDKLIAKECRNYHEGDEKRPLIYTRYADDMLISGFQGFDKDNVMSMIRRVLKAYEAPYEFKDEKTRYGSREGRNWNLGVMLNKDNNITVGHRNKKHFRAMLTNYVLDKKNGVGWSIDDVQHMQGLLSYYTMIEAEYFGELINKINDKYKVNVKEMIKQDLYSPI